MGKISGEYLKMAIIGFSGERIFFQVSKPGTCFDSLVSWDDVQSTGLSGANFITLTNKESQIGLDIHSGSWVWYPTSQIQTCIEPLFIIYPKAYSDDGDIQNEFYLTGSNQHVSCVRTSGLGVDEKYLYWSGNSYFNNKNWRCSSGVIVNPYPLPANLKTSIRIPETLSEFGFYYVIRKNPNYTYGPLKFYSQSGPVFKDSYNEWVWTSNHISSSIVEFLPSINGMDLDNLYPIGYFDFSDIIWSRATGVENDKISMEYTTLPDGSIENCLIIGKKGNLGLLEIPSGHVYVIDPVFGPNDAGSTNYQVANMILGSYIHASSNFQNGTIDQISFYLKRGNTSNKSSQAAIYISGASQTHTLLASSQYGLLSEGGAHWERINFQDPKPIFTSGETYYLTERAKGTNTFYFQNLASNIYRAIHKSLAYTSGFPETIISPSKLQRLYSINILVTPYGSYKTKVSTKSTIPDWTWDNPTIDSLVLKSSVSNPQLNWIWDNIYSENESSYVQITGSNFDNWYWSYRKVLA